MRLWALIVLGGCTGLSPPEQPVHPGKNPVSPGEIAQLHAAGLSNDAIIANIEREGVAGGLSIEDGARLRELGVSEPVLRAYRIGRVVAPSGPVVPIPRRPPPEYGRLNDPAWYWEQPWQYPAPVE